VLTDPDASTLNVLAKQNRFFSGHLTHLAKADGEPFPQFHTWADNPPKGSEELQRAYEDLGWNIETIVQAINQLKTIKNVDLSGVALSRIVIGTTDKLRNEGFRLDGERFEKGITFQNVNLEGANLAGMNFDDATFRDTNFKDALLASTNFFNCNFSGSTSLSGFKTELFAVDPTLHTYEGLFPRYAVNWYGCNIDVVAFFPALPIGWQNWQSKEQQYFFFFNCTWKVPGVTSPPIPRDTKKINNDQNGPQEGPPSPYPPKLILAEPGNNSNFDGMISL
jgi:hypothetical protein